jgi:hypothetical protein
MGLAKVVETILPSRFTGELSAIVVACTYEDRLPKPRSAELPPGDLDFNWSCRAVLETCRSRWSVQLFHGGGARAGVGGVGGQAAAGGLCPMVGLMVWPHSRSHADAQG